MTASALDGLLVVDMTSGVNGAYATKLLANLGARVIVVEPPEGNPLRFRPLLADADLPGDKAYGVIWAHLAGGKESLQPDHDVAVDVVGGLLNAADILLVDGTSPYEAVLPAVRPESLVEVDLSPFGRSGSYSGWRGSDIATWAMGGYMYFTGEKSREPLMLPGSQAELHAACHAAFSALVGVWERRRSGWGQQIEVTDLESALSAHAWLISSWAACGQLMDRDTHDLIRCADGWIYLMTMAPNPNIFLVIDKPELMAEEIAIDLEQWADNVPQISAMFGEWARDKTRVEIAEKAQGLRVACTPVFDAEALYGDAHTTTRNFWETGDDEWATDPAGAPLRFPGQPFQLSASPSSRAGSAPALGAQSDAITDEFRARPLPARPAQPPQQDAALRGVKVVEVTANWAGPIAGRHLGDLGAEVVKVEWAAKPATRGLFWPGPELDLQRQGYNRAMYFNLLNRNKRDVVIDLSDDRGKEIFKDLIRDADVLIENNSARVMPNLGLGWEDLKAVNPRLIMVSMSGYGATGPNKDWVAYGSNIETTSGLTALTGYEPEGPRYRTTLFYADPVSGIHGAVAIMAALEYRRRTGEGQWIDISLNETGAAFCLESMLEYQVSGTIRPPMTNRDPRFAPQGAYPAAGIDKWVAISVQDDDDWLALCDVMGRSDLAEDPELAELSGRWARHDAIDAAIRDWTATLEQHEVAWALQRVGVSAAPVFANWQILPDPHLHERGFYIDVEHPVVGVYPYASWPWQFSRTPAEIRRAAPVFAEHNRDILSDLGLAESEIDDLYTSGVTADVPILP